MKPLPITALVLLLGAAALHAEVRLASPFTDHLVLQRGQPVPVWGLAAPGERIAVSLSGAARAETTAADDGKWRVDLPSLPASSVGATLSVTGSATAAPVELHDVLVGEVWLCSGQSNMDFTLARTEKRTFAGVENEAAELAAAQHPRIRMFTADWQLAYEPCATVTGQWRVCTPETARDFSAVGYYYARALERELDVPVGIITVAFGASTAQAWIRREAIAAEPRLAPPLAAFDGQVAKFRAEGAVAIETRRAEALAKWEKDAAAAKAAGTRAPRKPRNPDPVQDQHNPTVLYNGMVAPLLPYALRGFVWYQGESITAPNELFPVWNATLIRDWRALWGAELPFYFVQLAALDAKSNSPTVRARQAEALALPHTGMAVAIDVGDRKDVHPKRKGPVGERLALLALAHDYGRNVEYSGPAAASVSAEGAKLSVRFTHAAGLTTSDGAALKTFELAGADGKFVPASATIDAGTQTVTLQAEGVTAPTAVRYAWAGYPDGCNLTNAAGLPAAPFQLSVTADK